MDLQVTEVEVVEAKPNYQTLGEGLLEMCERFYQDPENEKAFQEWLREEMRA